MHTYTSHLHYVTDVALKLFLTRCTPGFFEITFVQLSVCLSLVCVFALEATNNYSHEMKPELPVKQVVLVSVVYIQHLPSIFFETVALVMKHTANSC